MVYNIIYNKAAFVQEIPPKSGKYEIVLDPAEYRINIFKEGYEEVTKTFLAKPGTNNLKISMKQRVSSGGMQQQASNLNNGSEISKKKAQNSNSQTPIQKEANQNNQNQQNAVFPQQNANLRPTSAKSIPIFIFDAMTNQPIPNVTVQVLLLRII